MSDSLEYEFDIAGVKKNFMFVNRKAPHGSVYALEILEMILISAAFEQHAVIAFIDDGVFQIKKGQNAKSIGMKNFLPTYGVVEMEKEDADEDEDIDMVWRIVVDEDSMKARGLDEDDFSIDVEVMNSDQLKTLMNQQDVVISA